MHDIDPSVPDTKGNTKDDGVSIIGVDLDLPLSEKPAFSLLAYADAARMEIGKIYKDAGHKSGGMGYAFGFMGNIVKFIGYRLEYRGSQRNFISQYFDSYYENTRTRKPSDIAKTDDLDINQTKQGPYLEIGFNLLGKISFITTYENMDEPYLYSEFNVDPALLMNKCSFSIAYAKKGDEPIMTTRLGYQVSSGVFLILTRKKTFDPAGKSIETTYIETKMKL
ncbi:MAG TPA: hypothetical protein DHV62_04430 [Elusimicrobia bacterium]|nr:hypothetical protein [Elusimicrobiota bacterium]